MKSNWKKRLLALGLAGLMALSLAACGDKQEQEGQAETSGMTAEEYQQAVTTLSEDIHTIQTEAEHVSDDPDAAREALEQLKTTLSDFMALEAPEKYAAGHEKVREGCEAMIEYIDLVIGTTDDGDAAALEQVESQMQTAIDEASVALQEGVELLQQADDSE